MSYRQKNVRFILVETSHPGNLGASSRAIANMGFTDLALVRPKASISDPVAISRAANSTSVLENAVIFDSLDDAISGCSLVFATRARSNTLKWREYTPEAAAKRAEEVLQEGEQKKIAIVFGPEKTGLSNEMLEKCCAHIVIPTASYASLNLAQAVQILSYELFLELSVEKNLESVRFSSDKEVKADSSEVQGMLKAMENIMVEIEFLDPKNPKKLMPRLRSLFMRCDLSENEVQMLRGFISSIDKKTRGI